MRSINNLLGTGFVRKSTAPALMVRTVVGYVAIGGEEDNRQMDIAADELSLQFVAVHTRHVDVKHQTAWRCPDYRFQESARRFQKSGMLRPSGFDNQSKAVAYRIVVIDNKNAGLSAHNTKGKVKWTLMPVSAFCSAHIFPPCASIKARLMARPMPKPVALVV